MRYWREYPYDYQFERKPMPPIPNLPRQEENQSSNHIEEPVKITSKPEVIVPEKPTTSEEIHSNENSTIQEPSTKSTIEKDDLQSTVSSTSSGGWIIVVIIALFFIFGFNKY